MTQERPPVVITGVGIVSPLGIGRVAFWDALIAGRSGIRAAPPELMGTLPVMTAGQVDGFDPAEFIKPRKAIKLMCRESQLAFAAAMLAAQDADLSNGASAADRMGVLFGSQMFYGMVDELAPVFRSSIVDGSFSMPAWGRSFGREMFPLWLLNYLPNMPACHIAIALQALGPNNTIVQGDASGLLALMEATSVIQRGWADVMLVGSVGSHLAVTREIHVSLDHISPRRDDVESACRPFDAACDGTVLAEGAAAVVLESSAHAKARGA
ncbi:MAG TPA: beta-ketoacyl synthase N-terminal-like domain-containing protein, partial [Pirellulaceae bacterium]